MTKLADEMQSTELAPWRKKGLVVLLLLLSITPFYLTYSALTPEANLGWWELRHFVAMAGMQAGAQFALAWFIWRNSVPNYVMFAILLMAMSFQASYGICVVLLANG
ncbi:hypothetical protein JYB87_11025 [Shewanella avicenniae]|uniref:Uncharacterized protein n=1 Tax=Shewanella avicenniae TaxID=2814294 RepID=A0ABX7QLI3_9GAMM|nr:hypothetical protein [Shewanella avicenniae]QSX32307.1 hypothetical protein JYB87_11025 [Shewanella avicenniae]